ncbi:MAG: cyclase family protein [Saprospiraceae bacterium]|nr:cyclase family protein [Saprospiraceae bacterium]
MSNQIIDISVPLHPGLPVWPGSHGVHISRLMEVAKGDIANVSRLDIDVHSGSHIDAPLHFLDGTDTTDDIPLDKMVGPCWVADFRGQERITAAGLEAAAIPADTRRLLFKTDNSSFWKDFAQPFRTDFTSLTLDAAQWVAARGIELVGIDCHSIQLYDDPFDTHIVLLERKVVIVESLNLRDAAPGAYELICLPLRVRGLEGVPVRAVLRTL